jgi:hypothetical protein
MKRLGNGLKSDPYASIPYVLLAGSIGSRWQCLGRYREDGKWLVPSSFREAESQDRLNSLVACHSAPASFSHFLF